MPLRCLDGTGQSIRAFDFGRDRWQELVLENRKVQHLKMPCCGAQVVLKTSLRGLRFFAHKSIGACITAVETEEHLHLKQMIVTAAHSNGWVADTEIYGKTPSGARWKADVLALKGKHIVAAEVQWSGQSVGETLRRQAQYKESGVRGLWLLRNSGFPVTHVLPAVCIAGNLEDGFTALIPATSAVGAHDRTDPLLWRQVLPMDDFLNAVFSGRFRFGAPLDMNAVVSIWAAPVSCWSCGTQMTVITRIELSFGAHAPYFSLAEFGEHRDLVAILLRNLPANAGICEISFRPSQSMGGTYLGNGCAHCGALYGETYVFPLNTIAAVLHQFSIKITPAWKRAIESQYGATWSVYAYPLSQRDK